MLNYSRGKWLCATLCLTALAVIAGALADEAVEPATGQASAVDQQWKDFVYYVQVARPEAALAFGKAIVESEVDPRVVYQLSVQTENVVDVLARGEKLEGLGEIITDLRKLIEQGYRLNSRDPEQIAKAIEMLGGSPRQIQIGAERLIESAEYAVPQMIQRLGDPKASLLLRIQLTNVLGRLGRSAVRPLCAALAAPDPGVKEVVCQALGEIGYWHSAPYLRALLADENEIPPVKAAAKAALIAVTNDKAADAKPVAPYFFDLANKYYTGEDSIQPDRRFDTANVWYWKPELGLTYKEVPTVIFLEVYAMRLAREALAVDNRFYPAVSLWLAANLRRESRLGVQQTQPAEDAGRLGAEAYVMAAGAKYAQEVLARALTDGDAAVATGAIKA
ncbi:MAG: HEAT repeat domain-containing protein, partial [Planctomycetes bacterium]|nr:HEAT repeat domain-containing protein [Planctomycetota bacterium]